MIALAVLFHAAVALAPTSAPIPAPRLLRYPAIYHDSVVFTYGGNLWRSELHGGLARRLTATQSPQGFPYFSPDGKWLAFTATYDGLANVYVMPSEGGEPKRLTFDPEGDLVTGWTPAGEIAYVTSHGSPMARQSRLMLVGKDGGLPQETPILEVGGASFSPDGRRVVYDRNPSNQLHWRRYRGGSQGVISIYDLSKNTYAELPHGTENSWNPLWVGNQVYFISDKAQGTVNLYAYDLGSKKQTQLTHYADGDIKSIRSDGTQIVFERDGFLYDMNLATQAVEKLAPDVRSDNVLTRPALKHLSSAIGGLSLSPSGNRLAVEARGRIYTVPAHNGEIRPIEVSDVSRAKSPNWSPDGKTIAFLSDTSGEFQIYTAPQMGLPAGKKPTLHRTDSALKLSEIDWLPDSQHLIFTTLDGKFELMDLETGKYDLIAQADGGVVSCDYSPDANWIAYVKAGDNGFTAVWLYDLKTKKSTQVTEGYYRDGQVAFDQSGKFLYIVSARTINAIPGDFERGLTTSGAEKIYALMLSKDEKNPFTVESDEEPAGKDDNSVEKAMQAPPAGPTGANGGGQGKKPGKLTKGKPEPEPETSGDDSETVRIDLKGLGDRIISLPLPAGSYPVILGADGGFIYSDGENVARYEIGSPEPTPILEGFRGMLVFNASRQKLAYDVLGNIGIADVHPAIRPFEGRIDTSGFETVVDPRKEWREIYWDAWRWERDAFYDPKFTGVDWNAVGKEYAAYLDDVTDRSDLNYVIGLMIGELGTSHAYVAGGDFGPTGVPAVSVGQLGVDYTAANGKLRLKKIYRGLNFEDGHHSPLAEPGVNAAEGDYLLAIDGHELSGTDNPDAFLVDKAGRTVTLTLNSKPEMAGAHTVTIKPLASEADARYDEWVEDNRKLVSRLSGGKVGYMHVPDTDADGIVGFVKGFYSQSNKQALVVDERWNSGGDIPTFFTEKLSRSPQAILKGRYGRETKVPSATIDGPKVLLINGYAGSGGDLFAYLFRRDNLGQLIGTRTWGGLVGYNTPYKLVDGGMITAPQFGLYDPSTGKWIAENHGIDPDIESDLRPDLVAQGRDPQLEKAVQVLLAKLKGEKGSQLPKPPKYPDIHTTQK